MNTSTSPLGAAPDDEHRISAVSKRHKHVPGRVQNRATTSTPPRESLADAQSIADADVQSSVTTEGAETTGEGAGLLDEIVKTIREFVNLKQHQYEAITLWLLASRGTKFSLASPLLYFAAPSKACGKTKALSIVSALVRNPVKTSSITAAAVYRTIDANAVEETLPTLVMDNVHLYLREDSRMIAILAGGFDRDFAKSIVSGYRDGVPDGVEEFSTWSPKVSAGNGPLPDVLMDHSIVISLSRKPHGEPVQQVAYEKARLADLREKIDDWFSDNETRIQAELRTLSDGRDNRTGDKWAAMLAIAQVAGEAWPQKARNTMRLLERPDEDSMDTHERVLHAVHRYFHEHDGAYAKSQDIVAWMNADPEAPWSSFGKRGEPFSIYNLRDSMTKFQVRSANVEPVTRHRGYRRADLQPLFESYPLPDD